MLGSLFSPPLPSSPQQPHLVPAHFSPTKTLCPIALHPLAGAHQRGQPESDLTRTHHQTDHPKAMVPRVCTQPSSRPQHPLWAPNDKRKQTEPTLAGLTGQPQPRSGGGLWEQGEGLKKGVFKQHF